MTRLIVQAQPLTRFERAGGSLAVPAAVRRVPRRLLYNLRWRARRPIFALVPALRVKPDATFSPSTPRWHSRQRACFSALVRAMSDISDYAAMVISHSRLVGGKRGSPSCTALCPQRLAIVARFSDAQTS
jgi:hypothetical protein